MRYTPILVLGCLFAVSACTASKKINNDPIKEREAYIPAQFELIKGEKNVPEWLLQGGGTSTGFDPVIIQETSYVYGEVCKPHDCASNRFLIIFKPDKTPVAGLLVTVKDAPEAVNNPQKYASFRRFGARLPEVQRYLLDKSIEPWKK